MEEIRIQCRDRHEPDDWTNDGNKITSEENLKLIQKIIDEGPIIIEHWYYRGASSPNVFVVDDMDNFIDYVKKQTSSGDILDIWSFTKLCNQKNIIVSGKIPDIDGKIPTGGAY